MTATREERAADHLAELFDDIERRVVALERGPRLSRVSIEGEPLPVYDNDGILRQTHGLQDDGTYTTIDVNGPPPPEPTTPVVTERPGVLVVTWDGLFAAGLFAPLDFDHVEVHVWTVQGFVPDDVTQVATIYSGRGESITLALDAGVTYYVKLVAVSTSGTESEPSGEVAAEPMAPTTGAGGVQTFHEATEPLGLTSDDTGALWFDSDDQNHPYRWDGAQWVDVRDGSVADAAQSASDAFDRANEAWNLADQARAVADGAIRTYYQDDAPWPDGSTQPDANLGDMWFRTADAVAFRWNGAAWEVIPDTAISEALATAQNAQTTADGKITAYYSAAQPWANGDPAHAGDDGDLWYDTDDGNRPYYYDGAAWRDIRDAGIAAAQAAATAAQGTANQAVADAADAQATADGKVATYFQTAAPTGLAAGDVGDLWFDTDDGYRMYRWDGAQWVVSADTRISQALADAAAANTAAGNAQTTANSKIVTLYQAAQPSGSGRTTGDLWVDLDDGNRLYRWDGAQWVDVRDAGIAAASAAASAAQTQANSALTAAQAAQATADGAIRTYYQADPPWANNTSQPASVLGDMWFDTDDGQAYRWNGTTWQVIEDSTIGVALAAAQNAQTTADGKVTAWYQPAQPWPNGDANHVNDGGDLWYDTDDGNKAYYYTGGSGGTWTPLPVGTSALADLAVNTAKLADNAVTDAKVLNLSASKITVGTLDVSGGVVIYSDLGTDTDSRLLIDTAGLTAYDDAGNLAVNIDSSGRMKITGSFYTSTVPTGAQIEIGDLAGTGAQRTFINMYMGDERDAAGNLLAGYVPGKIESGWSSGGTVSTGSGDQRYVRIVAPDDPTRSVGALEIRSSNALGVGDRPTLVWSGDIKTTGSKLEMYSGSSKSDRKRFDLIGSQIYTDVTNGVFRIDSDTSQNLLVSRNSADSADRKLWISSGQMYLNPTGALFKFNEAGDSSSVQFSARTLADDGYRQLEILAGSILWNFPDGSATFRGLTGSSRFQIYNGAAGANGTGISIQTGGGVRISNTNPSNTYNTIAASAFNVNSERIHKTGVTPVTPDATVQAIRSLGTYEYRRDDDRLNHRGLMSDEVAAQLPILVDADGNIDLYGLTTSLLMAVQYILTRLPAAPR